MSYPSYHDGDLLALAAVGLPLRPCEGFWIQAVDWEVLERGKLTVQFGSKFNDSIGLQLCLPVYPADPCEGKMPQTGCPIQQYEQVTFGTN